ncbi:MAG: hypothetical protein D6754_00015 [Alphaproteobacteria bacterium]|nr:MAG: hypothetical protein D6754_00015 [Alphaproteobacteria bacterium]
MIRHILASGLFAGVAAGLLATALQLVLVVPLIVEAERYESGEIAHFAAPPPAHEDTAAEAEHTHTHLHQHEHDADAGGGRLWGMPRSLGTLLSGIVSWSGFGLLLVAALALANRAGIATGGMRGLAWGLAGFAALQFAPALGLAPELPGSGAAPLVERQIWWLAAALATAAGLGLALIGQGVALRLGGLVLIALPHLIGAPHPAAYAGVVPPELAALFAARSLGVGAVGWAVLGLTAGYLLSRQPAAPRPAPV